ncbi:MAG TPA: SgcJ/EcaC family oxidoreductase [Actinophytocola sp.]|jgi:uncharacterized protein (TIGR02246 family)|uniref:YybH family protein n=1 Tax=Actinophytocola sp. TaxID=1872138 RepID=UPI002F94464C
MTTQHDETALRALIDTLVEAVRAKDLDRVARIFAPDIVSYDIEPPMRHLGAAAKAGNWARVFGTYQELDYEVRDLALTVSGDVAFVHSLNRLSGTLTGGHRTATWVRWTGCFRRIDGTWLIAHDHVSVPLDLPSGKALLDLEP